MSSPEPPAVSPPSRKVSRIRRASSKNLNYAEDNNGDVVTEPPPMINLNLLLPKHVDDDLRNPQRCQIKTLGGADIKKAPFFDNYAHYDLKTFKELLVTEGNKARENGGKELKSVFDAALQLMRREFMSPAVSQKYKDVKELEAEVAVMNAEIELKKSGKDSKAVKSTGGSKKITKSDLTSAKKKLESARKALPPWSEVDPEAKVDDLTDPTLEQGKLKILPTAELMEHYEKRSANLDQPCCVAFENNKPDDSKGKLLYYFETSENSAAKEVSAARPPPDEILAKGVENLFKATGNGKKKKKKKGVPEERPSHGFKHDDLVWVLMVHGNWWPAVIRDLNQARKDSGRWRESKQVQLVMDKRAAEKKAKAEAAAAEAAAAAADANAGEGEKENNGANSAAGGSAATAANGNQVLRDSRNQQQQQHQPGPSGTPGRRSKRMSSSPCKKHLPPKKRNRLSSAELAAMEAAETKAAMEAEKKAVTEAERKAVAEAEKKADMEIESAARKNAESISEAFSFPSHREDKEGVELLGVQFIGDEEFEVSWVRVDHLRHYGCPDKMDIMTQMLEKYDSRIQARETLLQSEVKAEEESNSKKKKRKTAKKKAKELLEQEGDVDMDSKFNKFIKQAEFNEAIIVSRLLTNPPPGGVKIDTTVTDLIHSLVDTDHGLVPDKPLPKETPGKVQKALGKSRTDKQYAETTARKAAARAEKRRQSGAGKKTENGGSSSKQRQQNGGSGRRKRN